MVNYRPKRLGIVITDRCENNCAICGISGIGANSDSPELSVDEMKSYVGQAYDIGVRRLEITGGEPTKRFQDAKEVMRCASAKGMHCGLTTNASYAISREAGIIYAREFKDAGLRMIRFSIDKDHSNVPYENWLNALRGSLEVGIEDVCVNCINRMSNAVENLALLRRVASDLGGAYSDKKMKIYGRELEVGLDFAERVGKARQLSEDEFFTQPLKAIGKCGTGDIIVKSNGDILPCCSFFAFENSCYVFGNAKSTDFKTVSQRINDSIIGSVLEGPFGTKRLLGFLQTSGNAEAAAMSNAEYTTFCDYCNRVLTTPTTRQLVDREFQRLKRIEPKIVFDSHKMATEETATVIAGNERIRLVNYLGPLKNIDYSIACQEHCLGEVEDEERKGNNMSNSKKIIQSFLDKLQEIKASKFA